MFNPLGSLGTDLLIKILIPVLMPLIIVPFFNRLQEGSVWLDNQSVGVKNTIAFILSTLMPLLTAATGVDMGNDPHMWTQASLGALVTYGLSVALKRKQTIKAIYGAPSMNDVPSPTP